MRTNMRRPGTGLGFALGTNINAQTGAGSGGGVSFSTSFSDINTGIFGVDTDVRSSGSSSEAIDTTKSEELQIDEVGLLRLIDKALQGEGGLASIFGGEAGAGLFGSSGAKLQTEDLLAKIAGDLAVVTGKKVATEKGTKDITSQSETLQDSSGILDSVGSIFGF